jgi:signal transduction histidine kinase
VEDPAKKDIRIPDMAQRLRRAFEETFVDALIPGILHNFANPLNGIMGRAQLLERRLNDSLGKIATACPTVMAEFGEPLKKIASDVQSICQETGRLYDLFQDVSGKFSLLGSDVSPAPIDLSRLLAAEMRFADGYLDFKHEIRKEMDLEDTLPEITGVAAYYSLCFWSLFRGAAGCMRASGKRNLRLSTSFDETHVIVRLRHGGRRLTDEERPSPASIPSGEGQGAVCGREDSPVRLSLSLLQRLGAEIDFLEDGEEQETIIRIPYGPMDEKNHPGQTL